MCDPVTAGVATFASGTLGAIGDYQNQQNAYSSQVDAVNRQNEYTRRQWDYTLKERDRSWNNELAIWNAKRGEHEYTLQQNASAAGRAYASEQLRLNEAFKEAAFAKQAQLSQLVSARGTALASGQSGKTAAKIDQSILAAFGRNNAIMSENLAGARNNMIRANEETRQQLNAANMRSWRNVQFAPQPTTPPPTPMLNALPNKPSQAGMWLGIGQSALSGFSTYSSLKAPAAGNIPKEPTFNPNPGASGISPSGAQYYGPAFGANYKPYNV